MTDLTPLERERMTTIFQDDITGETYDHYLFQENTAASVPFSPSMGRSYGEYHGRYTPWMSRRGSMQHLVKRRGWKKGEATKRCQTPARGQNTNDDDEMISFISSLLRKVDQLLIYCKNKAALSFNRCTDTISHMNTMRIEGNQNQICSKLTM